MKNDGCLTCAKCGDRFTGRRLKHTNVYCDACVSGGIGREIGLAIRRSPKTMRRKAKTAARRFVSRFQSAFARSVATKKCPVCSEVISHRSKREFCSASCSRRMRLGIHCVICGSEIGQGGKRETCSRQCYNMLPRIREAKKRDKRRRRAIKASGVGEPYNKSDVFVRDRFRCQYCNKQVFTFPVNSKNKSRHSLEATIDHLVPLAAGGLDCETNVVTACRKCNNRKGVRMPLEFVSQLTTENLDGGGVGGVKF